MKYKSEIHVISIFFLFLALCSIWIGLMLGGNKGSLQGVYTAAEKPNLTWEGLFSGDYQKKLTDYWNTSFPCRNAMVFIKNDILVRLFSVSPNSQLALGKNHEIFEVAYLNEWSHADPQNYGENNKDEMKKIVDDLLYIQNWQWEHGNDFYVIITPSKAEFATSNIPWQYKLAKTDPEALSNYEALIELFNKHNIAYFDTVEYLKNQELPCCLLLS